MPRHPLTLGSTILAPVIAPAPPPFWTPLVPAALSWNLSRGGQIPRFEHVYPQESGGEQQFRPLNPSIVS